MSDELKIRIPALEQLLKITASGIGAVAGPILARWQARAQAEALRINAAGKADSLRLITSAQSEALSNLSVQPSSTRAELDIGNEIRARTSFQEEKRQRNIEAVVRQAAENIVEKEVLDEIVDHDWTAAFFGDIQDVSSERMQQIWAKILAGEVERPGTTSIRALSILKTMSQRDAQLFQSVTPFVIEDFVLRDKSITKKLSKFPSYYNIMRLAEIGLMHSDTTIGRDFENASEFTFDDVDKLFRISSNDGKRRNFQLPSFALTFPGMEIYKVMKTNKNELFMALFSQYFQRKGMAVSCCKILSRSADGRVEAVGPLETITPKK